MRYYTLDENGDPQLETDPASWNRWFNNFDNRNVALTRFGEVSVSTVFLGMDHSWDESGPPVLWETMIFNGPIDFLARDSSREAALTRHTEAVKSVVESRNPKV